MADIYYEDTPVRVVVAGTPQTLTASYIAAEIVDQVGEENLVVGPQGDPGPAGRDGAPGVGVPAGGTAGQVLAKSSSTDYATGWVTPLAIGTTSTTALRGDARAADVGAAAASHTHTASAISDSTTTGRAVLTATDAAAARTATGAAPAAASMGVIVYAGNVSAARPTGHAQVAWVGWPSTPTNWAAGDVVLRAGS